MPNNLASTAPIKAGEMVSGRDKKLATDRIGTGPQASTNVKPG
jgi:hypothetical protein